MAELSLGSWQERPYGWFAKGHVGDTPVRVRSPHTDLDNDELPKIINLNGLTAGHESMAVPARVAAGMGYAAFTLDYTNRLPWRALQGNADDCLRVIDAIPDGDIGILGLSMGGAVATRAAAQTDRQLESLTLVAPGAFIDNFYKQGMARIALSFGVELIDEGWGMARSPRQAYAIGRDTILHSIHRVGALPGEAKELLTETMYDELHEFREAQPDTRVVLAHASHDKLIRRKKLLASFEAHETHRGISLTDAYVPYDGAHARIMYDPDLAEEVITASSPDRNSFVAQRNAI